MEDFHKPTKRTAVNLPAVFAMVAAGHLLIAAVAMAVIVIISVAKG